MNLSETFSLEKLLHLQNLELTNIKELNLLQEVLQKDVGYEVSDFSFGASAEAGISIKLFNDPTDDNEDDLAAKLGIDNLVNEQVFVNYHIHGRLKGNAAAALGSFSFRFESDQNISLGCYLQHSPQQKLIEAIQEDISDLKVLFDKEALKKLKINEAVIMTLRGSMKLDGKVQLSDTLTASINDLSKLVPLKSSLQIEVNSGFQLNASLAITDDYQIIIQRRADNFQVSIRKVFKRDKNLNGGFEVGAKLNNEESTVEELIDKLLNAVEKGIIKEIQPLLEKGNNLLSSEKVERLRWAAEKLKLSADLANPEDIKDKYKEKREELKKKIITILTSKVVVAATYEYSKYKSKNVVFEGTFNNEALNKHHDHIVKLRVGDIIKDYVQNDSSGIVLTTYEDLYRIDIKKAFKIGISIGKLELSQSTHKEFSLEEHNTIINRREMFKVNALAIGRTYERNIFGNLLEAGVQLNATLDEFVPKDSLVSCSMLVYEFSLVWSTTQNRTREEELRRYLDLAVLWQIIPEDEFAEKGKELEALVKNKVRKVQYKAFIKAPHKIFDVLLTDLSQADVPFQARTLAAATPYAKIGGRESISARILSYYGFWLLYLKQGKNRGSLERMTEELARHLVRAGAPELAEFEMDGLQDNHNHPYSGQTISKITEYNRIDQDFFKLQSKFNILLQNFNKSYKPFLVDDNDFKKRLFNQTRLQNELNMRFYGRLIIDLALKNHLEDNIEKAFTIEYINDKEEKHTIILG